MGNIKGKLGKIRNSSEKEKKGWLFLLTAVSMVIVVGLWIVYIKIFTADTPVNESKEKPPYFLIWPSIKNGLSISLEKIQESANRAFSSIVNLGKKEIEIKN